MPPIASALQSQYVSVHRSVAPQLRARTMPDYDGDCDLVTVESEGEYHSFTDQDGFSVSESFQLGSPPPERERQISVDPLSLRQPPRPAASGHLFSARPKFVSCSLPSSAVSSPKFGSGVIKSFKKWNNPAPMVHPAALNSLARQHSVAFSRFALEQKPSLRRSKSCGEGRSSAPSDGFVDILSRRPSICRAAEDDDDDNDEYTAYYSGDERSSVMESMKEPPELPTSRDGSFRCGCVFLPGLSHKKKQVTLQPARKAPLLQKKAQLRAGDELRTTRSSSVKHRPSLYERGSIDNGRISIVSKAASLEKFDCGSWSPTGLLDDSDGDRDGGEEEEEGLHSYFDLPLELIRNGHSDTDSPVRAAFVFEKDLKGVLKKSGSRLAPRQSHELSNRHVRFSTSMPTSYPASPSSSSACVTPRLRKAREEFNAFLEAQSA